MAIGGGIGIGGSAAVSRRIGEDDKGAAEKTAVHTILIGLMAADYATILFSGSIFIIFFNIANAILRGEGDARRAMYGLIVGAALNIVLDPLFIYVFGFGVIGAGIATLISMIVSSLVFSYWLFFKRNTYLHIVFRGFRFKKRIIGEILQVGIPASLSQISMAGMMLVLNRIIIITGGTDGVAVFTSGWRVIMLGIIPLIGLGTGVTAVTGAAFGQRDREKLSTAYLYAVKIGVLIELGIAVLVFVFTYSEEATRITEDLIQFLRIVSGFYPTVPLGMLTAAMLRGIGKGIQSLLVMLVRILVFQIPAAYLLGITFGLGLTGVWIGFVGGNIIAVAGVFAWGRVQTSRLSFPLATLKE
jgi:putative MATE family efflux protein